MANKKCPQCAETVRAEAKVCRFCGFIFPDAPAHPAASTGKKVAIAIGVLVAILIVARIPRTGPPPQSATFPAESASSSPAATSATGDDPWTYDIRDDKIAGKADYLAENTSTNSIAQGFPYSSDTKMTIVVRTKSSGKRDVMFQINSGQLMCQSFEECSGRVKFDDGAPEKVSFIGSSDNDSTTMFVVNDASFLAKLKKAKRLIVAKTLYNAGDPQFEFDVHGLKLH